MAEQGLDGTPRIDQTLVKQSALEGQVVLKVMVASVGDFFARPRFFIAQTIGETILQENPMTGFRSICFTGDSRFPGREEVNHDR